MTISQFIATIFFVTFAMLGLPVAGIIEFVQADIRLSIKALFVLLLMVPVLMGLSIIFGQITRFRRQSHARSRTD